MLVPQYSLHDIALYGAQYRILICMLCLRWVIGGFNTWRCFKRELYKSSALLFTRFESYIPNTTVKQTTTLVTRYYGAVQVLTAK